ncbi:pyrroloquinoline quinone precursor peptide PqqA [Streptomyces sp. P01-B04]|nr:pyrroloquinoline quinone precursor peptide PqqA [Streptomyces poriferorum]MBW5260835.1 pyrroloquinoline quinone precursor peptide PqqA [Streptomyces poriferorum]
MERTAWRDERTAQRIPEVLDRPAARPLPPSPAPGRAPHHPLTDHTSPEGISTVLEPTAPAPQDQLTSSSTPVATWSSPDFTVIETGMEVTAYYLNDL